MNTLMPSFQPLFSRPSSRTFAVSGTGNIANSKVSEEKLYSTRQEEFQPMETVNFSFPNSVSQERTEVHGDTTFSRSEEKATASTLQGMLASASGSVAGEKVTVSATGALFLEFEAQPKPWQPSSLSEAVDYRRSCMEKHRQTIEVLVDARAQGNVPESHLKDLEQAMLAADKKVFAAMKMCDQF